MTEQQAIRSLSGLPFSLLVQLYYYLLSRKDDFRTVFPPGSAQVQLVSGNGELRSGFHSLQLH